jgi:hypothetical protein
MALTITSFTPGTGTITLGSSTTLTAVFSGGYAVILPGNIPVNSGSAINVTPTSTTTYTLLLQDGTGATATSQTTVTVTIQATRKLGVGTSGGVLVGDNTVWIKGQPVYTLQVLVNPFSITDHIARTNDNGVEFDISVNQGEAFQIVGVTDLNTFLGQFLLTWA